jgi:site-specific DNA-methyltransferase (adenine-specific)
VDCVIADPPYNEGTHANAVVRQRPNQLPIDFPPFTVEDVSRLVCEAVRVARRWVVCFCPLEMLGDYKRAAHAIDERVWVRGGVWIKPDVLPQMSGDRPGQPGEGIAIMHRTGRKRWNRGGHPARWTFNVCHDDRVHSCQKPLDLMRALVRDFTDPGELILDPFAGSGTTALACLVEGRRFLGCEVMPATHATALERLRAYREGQSLAASRAGQTTLWGTP